LLPKELPHFEGMLWKDNHLIKTNGSRKVRCMATMNYFHE